MYRLALPLPFQITLVFGQPFEQEDDALRQATRLPKGFKVVPDDEIDRKAPTWFLPIRDVRTEPMKTEDIREYLEKSRNPITDGERVFISALGCYGTVSGVDGKQLVIKYGEGLSATFPGSALQRVQNDA